MFPLAAGLYFLPRSESLFLIQSVADSSSWISPSLAETKVASIATSESMSFSVGVVLMAMT